MEELGLTSGTVSVRMDRLVEQGLVQRQVDPDDKRNSRITLTDRGKVLFERIVPAHLANEHGCWPACRAGSKNFWRRCSANSWSSTKARCRLEGPHCGGTDARASARDDGDAQRRRSAAHSWPAGPFLGAERPAAQAGMRQGDVLVRAGSYELRSMASLYAAIADPATRGMVRVEFIRGTAKLTVDMALGRLPAKDGSRLAETAGRAGRDEHSL